MAEWLGMGMPGKARRYPIDKIESWLKKKRLGPFRRDNDESERQQIRTEIERVKLQRLRGELLEVGLVLSLVTGHITEARAILEQLPDLVVARFPGKLKREQRQKLHTSVREIVADALQSLADSLDSAMLKKGKS